MLRSVTEVAFGLIRWRLVLIIVDASVVLDLIVVLSKPLLERIKLGLTTTIPLFRRDFVGRTVTDHGQIIIELHVVTRAAMSLNVDSSLV